MAKKHTLDHRPKLLSGREIYESLMDGTHSINTIMWIYGVGHNRVIRAVRAYLGDRHFNWGYYLKERKEINALWLEGIADQIYRELKAGKPTAYIFANYRPPNPLGIRWHHYRAAAKSWAIRNGHPWPISGPLALTRPKAPKSPTPQAKAVMRASMARLQKSLSPPAPLAIAGPAPLLAIEHKETPPRDAGAI